MQEEFYLNLPINHECIKLPQRDKEYLLRGNFLSEFFGEDEKALARSNLGITPKLEELKELIDRKVFEIDAVAWDTEPTEGHTQHVLDSDSLYRLYYTKPLVDELISELYHRFVEEAKIFVDEELDDNSTNPVLNKTIKYALDALYLTLIERTSSIEEQEQETNIDLANRITELESALTASENRINESIQTQKTEITGEINDKVSQINGQILEINNRISRINSSISETNTSISGINHEISLLARVAKTGSYNDLINNPTKLSEFFNDVGFVKRNELPNYDIAGILALINSKADASSVPTKVSDLSNDAGYINSQDISGKADKSELLLFIFLTESEYEELTEYVEDALYIVTEDEEEVVDNWGFGDGLPIILT